MQHFDSALAFCGAGRDARFELARWLHVDLGEQQGFRRHHKRIFSSPALATPGATGQALASLHLHSSPSQRWLRRWLAHAHHHVLWSEGDPDYPSLLRHAEESFCGSQPRPWRVLFVEGERSLPARPCVAIVGGRSCSDRGAEIAHAFAEAFTTHGLSIVSGMAEGIDAAAHRGALRSAARGTGTTIAVMATGMDRNYPSQHAALREAIAQQGAVVTRLLPGLPMEKFRFLQRNRIIAALVQAVLVVQARLRSGALSTAQAAADFGRGVFAVPGSIDDPRCKGCHQLIRQGATLVERVEDIYADMPWLMPVRSKGPSDTGPEGFGCRGNDAPSIGPPGKDATSQVRSTRCELDDDAAADAEAAGASWSAALNRLGHDPFEIHQLASCLGKRYDEALVEALRMEVSGAIVRLPDGRYERLERLSEADTALRRGAHRDRLF
jgi:DNA processing protein